MWGAFVRQLFAYLLTRRGKRALAFAATLVLIFVTALLLDSQLFMSATVTGIFVLVMLTTWLVQYWRVKQQDRAREVRKREAAVERAANAQARREKLDRAKTAVADAAKSVGEGAAGAFGAAKSGAASVGSRLRFWQRRNSSKDSQT